MKLFGRKQEKTAPVLEPQARGWNVDYRRPDDDENVVRVNQSPPKGFGERLFEFAPVAGVSYRQEDVRAFIEGKEREISLRREFVNEQHPNALAVWGLWRDEKTARSAKLGFVPREMNDALGDRPVAGTLVAMYRATGEKEAGLRIDVWGVRPKNRQ